MPHSLRAKLSCLRYKKIISDKDYDRLCKALDNECVLDKITEIIEPLRHLSIDEMSNIEWQILQVIDKYRAEKEHIGNTHG